MTTQTIQANVTDTNHKARGAMRIQVEFGREGPEVVQHDGQTYYYTYKEGTNHRTGLAVREMATGEDARLWITRDGQHVWED